MPEQYVTIKVRLTNEAEAILRQVALRGFDPLRSGRPDYGKALEAVLEVALRATADPSRKATSPTVWQQQVAAYKAQRDALSARRRSQRDSIRKHRTSAKRIK